MTYAIAAIAFAAVYWLLEVIGIFLCSYRAMLTGLFCAVLAMVCMVIQIVRWIT